jgi:hypothetical protein
VFFETRYRYHERWLEGIAETPAVASGGQLFEYVVALASEPSTVSVLSCKMSVYIENCCGDLRASAWGVLREDYACEERDVNRGPHCRIR